jgi:hypothetical protein
MMKHAICTRNSGYAQFFFSVLAVVLLLAGPAAAGTMYVDAANTSGVENGTLSSPFALIQRAIDAAVAGDVVSVAPGLYYENVTLKDLVDVISQRGPSSTVIDGQGGYVIGSWFQEMPVRASVDGFTIRNGSTLVHGVSTWTTYTRIAVRNCIIRDGGLGVRASINSGFTFENVVFYNTYQTISSIWGYSPMLKNVTIDKADQAVWSYQTAVQLQNTSITNARLVMWAPYYGYVYGSHNNFFAYETFTEGNLSINLTDSMSVDPLFQNPPDDYRLRTGSPLIDAGIDVGLPYYGTAPDIGAYESFPATPAEQVDALAVSIRDASPEVFRNPEEQRRHALYQKLMAVLNMLESIHPGTPAADKQGVLKGIVAKLENDILAKADGFFGGDPKNDWIVSQAEQNEFYPRVKELLDTVKAGLAAIP